MKQPGWLQKHLETIGAHNADGISRRARPRRCPNCGALTYIGLDATRAALTARVDPHHLTPADELAARLTGRGTYTITTRGGDLEIDPRSQWSINAHPAGTRDDVHPEHACGQPIGTYPPAIPATMSPPDPDAFPF